MSNNGGLGPLKEDFDHRQAIGIGPRAPWEAATIGYEPELDALTGKQRCR